MKTVVDQDFIEKEIRSIPDSILPEYTIIDELRRPLQNQEDPIKKTTDFIKLVHGSNVGSSKYLHDITTAMAGSNSALKKLSKDSNKAASKVKEDIVKLINATDLINKTTCANMDTPMLRYFITESQVLHPDVYAYIQDNIDEFPYFKQISEQIGATHFTIIADFNSIDPLFGLDCDNLPHQNIRTSARMVRALFFKLFIPIYGNMEDVQSFLDTLYLRALPIEGNNIYYNPNYLKKGPLSHGNNYAMDVFHMDRAIEAVPEVYAKLMYMFGDRLRLLNHIFPVKIFINYEHKLYEINVEDSLISVDRLNRNIERRNMSNSRSLEGNEDRFEMEADSENHKSQGK